MNKVSESSVRYPLTFFLQHLADSGFSDPDVKIAPTIIYEQGRPVAWYDSVQMGSVGIVKPRPRRDLTSKNVKKAWQGKQQKQQQALAPGAATVPAGLFVGYKDAGESGNTGTMVKHLNTKKFDDLFSQTDANVKGILMPFIMPPGPRNSMIRVNWSKHVFKAERRTNKLPLFSRPKDGDHQPYPANAIHFARYGNLVTFEGEESLSETAPVNASLMRKLKTFCDNLAGVIRGSSKLVQFTAYFKVGPNDAIHYLWSSSVKLHRAPDSLTDWFKPPRTSTADGTRTKKKKHVVPFLNQVPRGLLRSGTPELILPKWTPELKSSSHCAVCGVVLPLISLFNLPYSAIAIHHKQAILEWEASTETALASLASGDRNAATTAASFGEGPGDFPAVLAKLHPGFDSKRWELQRENREFLSNCAMACQECVRVYLDDPTSVVQKLSSPRGSPTPSHLARRGSMTSRSARGATMGSGLRAHMGSMTDRPCTSEYTRMPKVLLPDGFQIAFTSRALRTACTQRSCRDVPAIEDEWGAGESPPKQDNISAFRMNPQIFRGLLTPAVLSEYGYSEEQAAAMGHTVPARVGYMDNDFNDGGGVGGCVGGGGVGGGGGGGGGGSGGPGLLISSNVASLHGGSVPDPRREPAAGESAFPMDGLEEHFPFEDGEVMTPVSISEVDENGVQGAPTPSTTPIPPSSMSLRPRTPRMFRPRTPIGKFDYHQARHELMELWLARNEQPLVNYSCYMEDVGNDVDAVAEQLLARNSISRHRRGSQSHREEGAMTSGRSSRRSSGGSSKGGHYTMPHAPSEPPRPHQGFVRSHV